MNEEQNKESPPSTDDNQQQEQPLNPSSTDKTIVLATEKSESINPTSEIKDMEVHHHSHESHGKKHWKLYLWEFLMLFLAVFCGFLAEYQLEHKIEKDREKIYINSLIKDFEYDTLQFSLTINQIKKKIPFYDSVLLFLKNPAIFSD